MIVTKDYLLEYVRALDLRLESMTDEDLLKKIQYGINNLSDTMLCFFTQETICLNDYQDLGYDSFSYELSKFSIGELHTKFYTDRDGARDEVTVHSVKFEKVDNNTYAIKLLEALNVPTYLTFSYFYTPEIEVTNTLVVEPEVFHFLKHSIQVVVWGGLKDYEKEQYHQRVWDEHIKSKRISFPSQLDVKTLRGGFV